MRLWPVAIAAIAVFVFACDRKVAGGAADGPAIYAEVCARCHGSAGVPPRDLAARLGVRDLSDAEFQTGLSDAELRSRIRNGSPAKAMPAFQGALTEEQIAAVARFIRTLAR
ncbi:MAG: cytochrome c [Proteobacteria bacterium]|nr:cytochrome c [Pseudomonadota bacterium]